VERRGRWADVTVWSPTKQPVEKMMLYEENEGLEWGLGGCGVEDGDIRKSRRSLSDAMRCMNSVRILDCCGEGSPEATTKEEPPQRGQ